MMTRWVVLRVVPLVSVVLLAVIGVMLGMGRTLDNPVIAYFAQDTHLDGDLRLVDVRQGVEMAFDAEIGPFFLSNPMWLANGEDMIFAATGGDIPHIYRYKPGAGALHTLLTAPANGNIYYLSLAPDGEQVAYTLSEGTSGHVYLMNIDGTATRQITTISEQIHSPVAWSPDGTQMVFYSRHWARSNAWERAILVDVASGQQRTLHQFTDQVSITDPAWTADSNALLYGETNLNGASRIMRLDVNTGSAVPLLPDRAAQDALAIPAPTDDRIAIVTYIYTEQQPYIPASQINLLDPATGTLQTIYTTDQIVDGVQWSPDGHTLLLHAEPPQVSGTVLITSGQLLLLDIDSGEIMLTLNGDLAAWRP